MSGEEIIELITKSGRAIPKSYHDTLMECHNMGGDIKSLISHPTFELSDISKYYYELKMERYN